MKTPRLPPVPALIAVPVSCAGVMALLLVFGWGGPGVVELVDNLVSVGLAIWASCSAELAARAASGRARRAWGVLALALGLWAAGDLLWMVCDLLHISPFPSPADILYLAYTVVAAVAVSQFPTGPARHLKSRLFFEGLTVLCCLFLLIWVTGLRYVFANYGRSPEVFGLAALYPLGDMVLLTIAVLVLARADARRRLELWLVTIAIALATASDALFAYLVVAGRYGTTNVIDIGWVAALLIFIVAAQVSRRPISPTQNTVWLPSTTSLWLPYVPLLLAGTIGPALVMSGLERVVVPIIVVAVCGRQAVAAWDNRRLLIEAAKQALRDPLTGLANRTLFRDRLAQSMVLRRRDNRSLAVVSLDLNDFKVVNDNLGQPVADLVLIDVGNRIVACVRPGDTVARIGGDEFALILEGQPDDFHLVAERVVAAFDSPFAVDGQEMLMRPSVGMAIAGPDEPDLTPAMLIKRADIAMFAAKRSRSSGVHTFSDEMTLLDPNAALSDNGRNGDSGAAQVRLLGELRHAIDRDALQVVYQPKLELGTGRIVGVEALLRWPHPLRGVLRPEAFLPLVRQHGLMRPVTDRVLHRVLDDVAHWASLGIATSVAVNVFAPFMRDPQFPGMLCRLLDERRLAPGVLTIEITEDLVLSDVGRVTEVLHQLRDAGIQVAIDDFGSGYSALSYLRDLPIDEVKLDRHFVAPIITDTRAAAVVRAVIDLTHALGITVVAEGVEDADTADWLRSQGCDIGQGYYFGMPVAADRIPELIGAADERARADDSPRQPSGAG